MSSIQRHPSFRVSLIDEFHTVRLKNVSPLNQFVCNVQIHALYTHATYPFRFGEVHFD